MALVQTSTVAATYGGSSCTPTLATSTAGNHAQLYVVWSSPNSASPPSTPSGWTSAISSTGRAALTGGGYFTGTSCFYKENIAGGAISALVDGTSGAWAMDAWIEEWSGIATSGSLDQTAQNGATGSNTSGSVTTSTTTQSNEVVHVLLAGPGVNSSASIGVNTPPSSGYTSTYVQQNNQTHAVGSGGYKVLSATGTQTGSWTWSQVGEWSAQAVTWKLAGAGNSLALDFGTYTYTGNAATFQTVTPGNTVMLANSGSYSYIGAQSNTDLETVLSNGTYGLTGQVANLTISGTPGNFVLLANSGNYAYAGAQANSDLQMDAAFGLYTYSGSNAGLFATGASVPGGGSMMMLFGKRKR